jgi:hypothetical protein
VKSRAARSALRPEEQTSSSHKCSAPQRLQWIVSLQLLKVMSVYKDDAQNSEVLCPGISFPIERCGMRTLQVRGFSAFCGVAT